MDLDILLILGLGFVPLAFVAFVAAWADRRRPWAGVILLALALGMMGWAQVNHPGGGYDLRTLPELALEVVARFLR
ncbi:MAG: hypothetical protein ACK4LQ_08800 [Pararhodobacter sp.]